ncbi:histone deacetylase 15 [Tanacetum coccineum]
MSRDLETFTDWAYQVMHLKVMANADTLHDALTSRNNGAQGTGLRRTEHMVRPHGHHAGVKHAMEFCLHNNVVVAALAAQVAGAKKVLIVDWVMFNVSLASHITALEDISMRHEGGQFYPGTSAAHEVTEISFYYKF